MLNKFTLYLVVDTLTIGGAEIFSLRLASALKANGINVVLVVLRGDLISWPHYFLLAKSVELKLLNFPLLSFILKFDGLLFKYKINYSLLRNLQVYKLKNLFIHNRPNVVHSNLLTADLVTSRACNSLEIPWITTMHGDYLALENSKFSQASRILDFKKAFNEVEMSVSHMVCITDNQKAQLSRLMPLLNNTKKISKIYNGYEIVESNNISEKNYIEILHKLPDSAFVVGMVARGVREKGWDIIISAFIELNNPSMWLLLVGEGDYLKQLKDLVRHPRIIFCGGVLNPLSYIKRFDVACLPTQFSTESLPTVIIEYLLLGKPVIATDVGEISKMLEIYSKKPAGLLIDLKDTQSMINQLINSLYRLYINNDERYEFSLNSFEAFKKFKMKTCLDKYLRIYEESIG